MNHLIISDNSSLHFFEQLFQRRCKILILKASYCTIILKMLISFSLKKRINKKNLTEMVIKLHDRINFANINI